MLSGNRLQAEPTSADASQPQDLTGLSLEVLLHEEITPVNVLGSHTHLQGGFMVGYRYMFMEMGHNLEGTREVPQSEVLQRYPVVHTSMSLEMHMVELMYAPSDRLTLMAMVPFQVNNMNHLTRAGARFTDTTSGLGDLSFMGLYTLLGDPRGKGQRLLLNAGFTAPTGDLDKTMGARHLEYAMQLGSGTFDLLPGITYLGESDKLAWGAQVLGTVRLGTNDRDYRLGDRYRLSAWTQLKVVDWFGPSLRLDWHAWDDIHGADPDLDPNRNPAFDARKQSGERLDVMAGLNFFVPHGFLKGTRLAVEGGLPVYQNLDGPNMAVDWLLTVGLSFSFH